MSTAIVLSDVHLDDIRPNREGKITRFMERREQEPSMSVMDITGSGSARIEPSRSMVDVTFRMKEQDMFGEFGNFKTILRKLI